MSPSGETCVMGARHEAEIDALQVSDREQWTAINTIRNRLPTWATVAISLLTLAIGLLAAWAKTKGA